MRVGKKLLSVLLCLLILATLLPGAALAIESEAVREIPAEDGGTTVEEPLPAEAAEELTTDEAVEEEHYLASSGTCGTNLTWALSSAGILTISGTGEMIDYELGETPWCQYTLLIDAVVIKSGVTSIGASAFFSCEDLTSISIPASVISIGDDAFLDCSSLTSISIPAGVISIGGSAFYGCGSLKSIAIPNSVTSIGDWAFAHCSSLTSIKIPASVESIGDRTFAYCGSLTSISVASGNSAYVAKNGILYNKAMTELVCYPAGKAGTVSIPSGVLSIGGGAFAGCSSLTSISLPDSVISIAYFAFQDCSSLTDVSFGTGLASVGGDAFIYCGSLTSISVASGNSAYAAKNGILYNKAKTELIRCPEGKVGAVSIPSGVEDIGDFAFCGCSALMSISLPYGVANIKSYAFSECSGLASISVPNSVLSIDYCAFNYSSLTDVYYAGTEEQWNAIDISFDNDELDNAAIHFNSNSVIKGDVDDNNKVNLMDVSRLYHCLIVSAAGMNPYAADVNGDGKVTIRDVAALYNQVAGDSAAWNTAKMSVEALLRSFGTTAEYENVNYSNEFDLSHGGEYDANPNGYMAHNIYSDPVLSETSDRYDGFVIDFKADYAAQGTYWALCNWEMDLSSLPGASGGGAYCGLQNRWDGTKAIMSFWDIEYDGEIITPTLVYPVKDGNGYFDNEGSGAQYIVDFDWTEGNWYRMYLRCYEDEATGHTFVEMWVMDFDKDTVTEICCYDTKLSNSCFIGTMSQFMENYDSDYCTDVRSFQYANLNVRDSETGEWSHITESRLSIDTWWGNKKGTFAFGSTASTLWGITCGYGPDAAELNSDVYSYETIR